ncbi:MAG: pyridoxal phosphate-dependent aminotransferase, partial [Candidatus Thermoplasmatota archaeon]
MKELSFPLLGWLSDVDGVRHNLASSSVEAIGLSELGSLEEDMALGYPEDELEERLEEKIANTYESAVDIVLTAGAQAANSLICDSLLDNGDEVLVEDPAYTPLQTAPELKGAKVKSFKRKYEDGFEVDIEEIRERCSSDTRMIVITNPHNPSGVFQGPKKLRELGSFIEENDIYLLIDEIYRDFVEDGTSGVTISDNVIVTSSVSKIYGLGGLRLGWAVSEDEKLIDELKDVKSHLVPKNPTPTLKIGLKTFEERERLLKGARR